MADRKQEKKRKARGLRAHLNDFQRTASGEYVYTGATYALSENTGRSRTSALRQLWYFGGLALALTVVQGCIPAGGMLDCAYVLLPFAAELFSAASVIWALVRLTANPDPIREYVYSAAAEPLPRRGGFTAAFAGLACAGELVFALLHRGENTAGTWILAVLMAVTGASALLLRRSARTLHWEKCGK